MAQSPKAALYELSVSSDSHLPQQIQPNPSQIQPNPSQILQISPRFFFSSPLVSIFPIMISGEDIYKVVTAMLPVYIAMFLGYASIKWWQIFKPDDCNAINRFNYYFVLPFFTFKFMAHVNPYTMNFQFMGADAIAKLMIGVFLVLWANFSKGDSFSWSITIFSLSSLNNMLLLGVPLLQAMYGDEGSDLVVQSSVMQSLLWFICLLFMLELRRAKSIGIELARSDIEEGEIERVTAMQRDLREENNSSSATATNTSNTAVTTDPVVFRLLWFICLRFMLELRRGIEGESQLIHPEQSDTEEGEIEMGMQRDLTESSSATNTNTSNTAVTSNPVIYKPPAFWAIMKIVSLKLAKNPNSYACIVGLIWALVANRWHFGMPKIIEGSILIMSQGGAGLVMFNMGLFMAMQEKVIACGMRITLYSMILKFVIGPATTTIGALATGLRGDVLRIVVIQAALPEALTPFVYAQEYELHAEVLSTAVFFSTVVSLPLLIGYYAVLTSL